MVDEVLEGEVGRSVTFEDKEYWISEKVLNPEFSDYPLTKKFFEEDSISFKKHPLYGYPYIKDPKFSIKNLKVV